MKLDNAGTTREFLRQVDGFVTSVLGHNIDLVAERQMFREFVFLETLRKQFRQFLAGFKLPTDICDEDSRWNEFLKNYAGVIEDCALTCRAKAQPLGLVSEVVFKTAKPTSARRDLPFDLVWDIALKDGKTATLNANAWRHPKGGRAIFTGIIVHN